MKINKLSAVFIGKRRRASQQIWASKADVRFKFEFLRLYGYVSRCHGLFADIYRWNASELLATLETVKNVFALLHVSSIWHLAIGSATFGNGPLYTHRHTQKKMQDNLTKKKQTKQAMMIWLLLLTPCISHFPFLRDLKMSPVIVDRGNRRAHKKIRCFPFFSFFCLDKMSSPIVIVMLSSQEGSFLYFFLPSCFYFLFCFVFFSPATQVDSDRKTRVSVHWCKQGSCNA